MARVVGMLGARCVLTGINPPIAQTIVHMGVDLSGIAQPAGGAPGAGRPRTQTGHATLSQFRRAGARLCYQVGEIKAGLVALGRGFVGRGGEV